MPFQTATQLAAQTARSKARNLKIVAMRADGKTRNEIADALGITVAGLDKRMQRLLAAGLISAISAGTAQRNAAIARKSQPQPVARDAAMRRCLCGRCSAIFMSSWPGNRIAPGHAAEDGIFHGRGEASVGIRN